MATTFRNALLAPVLILGLAVEMKAQDRYEYASIEYQTWGAKAYYLYITISGSYLTIDGKVADGNATKNCTPIIMKAEEMSKDGWEVYNTIYESPSTHLYYLKRKAK